MTTPSYAWSSGSSRIDTHDVIFQKAVDMLPAKEKGKLEMNMTVVYLGLHAPDCSDTTVNYCFGDTDRSHHIYYDASGNVVNDDSALNARDEYQRAKESFLAGDMYNFSLHVGAMSHYIEDPGSWPHTIEGADFSTHTGYESAVNDARTELLSGTKSDTRKEMSAYDAALKDGYETTFDTIDGGAYDNNWMYANCGNCSKSGFVLSSNPELFDRTKSILNYNANRLSDVLYKLVREIKPDTGPTPKPTPIPTPSIVSYSPKSLSIEGQTPSSMSFNVTTDQSVDITWNLDSKVVQQKNSTKKDSYNDTVVTIGNHNVVAAIKNENGTNSKKWNWNVIGIFSVVADSPYVYVGIPKNVTFTVTRECGIESGDVCNAVRVPVPGVSISLKGKANGSNITDSYGQAIITINTTTNGTINVTASKSGYVSSSTTVASDIAPPPTPVPTKSGGGSSGGSSSGGSSSGGGGGGAGTAEPYENIYKYEIQEHAVFTTPVSFKYNTPDLVVYEVVVTSTQSNIASLRIEVLKNESKLVGKSAPGVVYKNLNAWIDYKRIKNVTMKYKVETPWIANNSLLAKNIRMVKWDNDSKEWIELPTIVTSEDNKYSYFESQADSIPESFVISGINDESIKIRVDPPAGVVPTDTEKVEQTENKPISTEVPKVNTETPKATGFGTMLTVSILSMVYIIRRIKR